LREQEQITQSFSLLDPKKTRNEKQELSRTFVGMRFQINNSNAEPNSNQVKAPPIAEEKKKVTIKLRLRHQAKHAERKYLKIQKFFSLV